MPKNPLNLDEFEKDEDKIYFGEKDLVCFACEHKIDNETEICSYCKTKQYNKTNIQQ